MAPTADARGPTDENRLKRTCDAGFLSYSGTLVDDQDVENKDSNDEPSSDSGCSSGSRNELNTLSDLAWSIRVFSESLLRMEMAEMEMARMREAARWEAETRRMESEAELTRVLLKSQLQAASFAAGQGSSKKRKRVDEGESSASTRERALVLSLLQFSLMIF